MVWSRCGSRRRLCCLRQMAAAQAPAQVDGAAGATGAADVAVSALLALLGHGEENEPRWLLRRLRGLVSCDPHYIKCKFKTWAGPALVEELRKGAEWRANKLTASAGELEA